MNVDTEKEWERESRKILFVNVSEREEERDIFWMRKWCKFFDKRGIEKSKYGLKLMTRVLSQFHQHFKSSLCANILAPKKYKPKI